MLHSRSWLALLSLPLLLWEAPATAKAVEPESFSLGLSVALEVLQPRSQKVLSQKTWPPIRSAQLKQEAETLELPLQITETLSDSDSTLNDGSRYDEYFFAGQAGQIVRISLQSDAFDSYLLLESPTGEPIAENDDGGKGTDAEMAVQLPTTGTYRVLANAWDKTGRGPYRLTVIEATAEELAQGEQQAQADALLQEGLEQYRVSQFQEALSLWQAALSLYRGIGNHQGEASALNSLGNVYNRLGQYQQAIDFHQQSLDMARELGDRRGEAAALGNLGNVYFILGQYQQAIDFHQQDLNMARSIGDRRGEAAALGNLGIAYDRLGQYQQAIDFHHQHLDMARSIGDRRGEAAALGNLGLAYDSLGQYQRAINFLEQTLGIARAIGNRQGEANSLGNLGSAYLGLGQYQRAIDFHQQHLDMARELGDRQGEAAALGNLGNVYLSLGQYQQAIDFHQQSLDIDQAIENRQGEASSLGNLGNVYNRLGQYQQAIDFQQQHLDIARELGDRRGEAAALGNLGSAYFSLGQYQQAIDFHQQSLDIKREIGDRQGEASSLGNLGNAYLNLGQYQQAIDFQQQSLDIDRAIGNRQGEASSLGNLGLAYDRLGQYQQAIDFHQQSLDIKRELEDRQGKANSLNNLGFSYLNLSAFPEAEANFLEAVAVLEDLRDAELSDTAKVSLFETQAKTYKGLEQTYILQNQPGAALETAERGRSRAFVELLTERLSRQQAELLSTEPPDLEAIQKIARNQQSVLVAYSLINGGPESPSLYIWVIQPSGQLDFRKVNLDEEAIDLSRLVTRSREAIGVRHRGGFELANQSADTGQLRQLHQLLIEPIADLLPANPEQKVVFIPQGPLFLVPFPALLDKAGTYLIEKYTILTAPAIQILDLSQKQRQSQDFSAALEGQDFLLIGNPIMPEVWYPDIAAMRQLSDLPGAEQEAQAIANFFDTTALLGETATEAIVKERISEARIVHLATHGLLEYGNPTDSGIRDIPGAIALTPGNGEDGLLTAAEIIEALDLNAELVVLSACDTGLGEITGDGVIGLSRSLIAAGTPSVIVSLWSVPDAPTAELMTEFYRQLQQGQDKAQALRQAMLETMKTNPDPVDWAAFTLIGAVE